ncbi:unnamed protein product [Lota lota]
MRAWITQPAEACRVSHPPIGGTAAESGGQEAGWTASECLPVGHAVGQRPRDRTGANAPVWSCSISIGRDGGLVDGDVVTHSSLLLGSTGEWRDSAATGNPPEAASCPASPWRRPG